MRRRLLTTLATIGWLVSSSDGHAKDAGETARICLEWSYDEAVYSKVKLGFTKYSTPAMPAYKQDDTWFDQVKDLFWELRFAPNFFVRTEAAIDRPTVSAEVSVLLKYPEMLSFSDLTRQMQELGTGSLGRYPPLPTGTCVRYGDVGIGNLEADAFSIRLGTPVHRSRKYGSIWPGPKCENRPWSSAIKREDLDFDVFKVCKFDGPVAEQDEIEFSTRLNDDWLLLGCTRSAISCTMTYGVNSWPVHISIRRDNVREWRKVLDLSNEFLSSVTVAKSKINWSGD